MHTLRTWLAIGLIADVAILAALDGTVGLDRAAWLIGLSIGVIVTALLARGLGRAGRAPGPADRVTLVRAMLVAGVAALVVNSIAGPAHPAVLVVVASLALALDAVDGRVARSTGTVSALGARFDMEVDALLILVLSSYDTRLVGAWVFTIGAARYLFATAGLAWPWLRESAPPRYWCKVVAAIQGVALTAAAAEVLPRPIAVGMLLVAAALLAESFGRDVWWLARHRRPATASVARELTIRV